VTLHDPRFAGKFTAQPTTNVTQGRCGQSVEAARLAYTQREAASILELVPPGRRMQAIGFDATLSAATSPELANYRIVHFATHGIVNMECPESSRLLLSMFDRQGHPQDGSLTLEKIFKLRWTADLVVLSACQTALGDDMPGEGLVGIARGFMNAGVPRVVASLWEIDGDAPADLMKEFYRGMLIKKLTVSEALRAAQLAFYKKKHGGKWSSAYYWAAFVAQGDWN